MSLVGTTLAGRYRIVELLGEGGMGAVYSAEQMLGATTRKVAIKTLHQHLSNDPKLRMRFEREVSTIAQLEHPNTIQVFDSGTTTDGILFIVMELAVGKSLADVLEQERSIEPGRATHILKQIAASLEEAHRAGIVHRDLKPENIMLTHRAGQADFVKVLDFGIARRLEDDQPGKKLTQAGTVLGTPPYMSPEQFMGQTVGPASDIYSLGIMAYEMVSGELPFHANTSWDWAAAHMTATPKPIEQTARGAGVPVAFREAVFKALEKAPSARFHSVHDFAVALEGGAVAGPLSRVALTMNDRAVPAITTAEPLRPGGTQMNEAVPVLRPGGTQMGGPLEPPPYAAPAPNFAVSPGPPPAGYGSPPQYPAPGPAPYPAAAAVPYYQGPPARGGGGGKSKTGLVIGLIGALVLCGGIIAFALSSGSSTPTPVAFPIPSAAPTPVQTTPAPPDTTPTDDGKLGGLSPAPAPAPAPAPNPNPAPKPKPAPNPNPNPNPNPAPNPNPNPNPTPNPTPKPNPNPNPNPTPNPTPKPNPTPAPVNKCAGKTGMDLVHCRTGG